MTPTKQNRMANWLESAWLQRYLDRQLDAEEIAWFEAYVLDKPELLHRVDADTTLRDALAAARAAQNSDEGLASASAEESPTPASAQRSDGAHGSRRLRTRARWLAAASLVAGFGLGAVGTRTFMHDAPPALIANPVRVFYDTMRGAAVEPRIDSGDPKSTYVVVDVAIPTAATDVRLEIGQDRAVAVTPSADGIVTFLLPRDRFVATTKVRLLYSIDGNDRVQDVKFLKPAMEY